MRRGNDEQALAILMTSARSMNGQCRFPGPCHDADTARDPAGADGGDAEPSWQRALQIVDQQPVDNVLRAEP